MSDRRWIAKRVDREELLHTDLPIDGEPTRTLSGAGSFRTVVAPEMLTLEADDGLPMFQSWGTELYLEEKGDIRWGGLVSWAGEDGEEWTIEAGGFGSYPHNQPFLGEILVFDTDPADIVRAIWAHLESFPDGNLGVEVIGSTSTLVGNEMRLVQLRDPETGQYIPTPEGEQAQTWEKVPYELHWADDKDCGAEINALAKDAPFDWVEEHYWTDETKTKIGHRIRIADWLGTKRDDLTFVVGVNVAEQPGMDDEGELYVSDVRVLGAGEGAKSPVGTAAVRRKGRLRRARIIEAKNEKDQARLNRIARAVLSISDGTLTTKQIVVRDHDHAPIGSWNLGDEVPLTQWSIALGRVVTRWHRIVSWRLVDSSTAVLDLQTMAGQGAA